LAGEALTRDMKYNWSIIGHEKQLEVLERDVSTGNLAHAYLLSGPNSVGKYTVAKKLAGVLQCEKDFCHECPTCIQLLKGCHLDTLEYKDDKQSLKVATIRELIERVNMTRQSKYRVVLIQTLERMTTEAANSFLKVLEEPPDRTIFILTTNSLRQVLPTIVSRVRVVKFASSSYGFLSKKLHELYPGREESEIENACLFSLGKAGKAVHLMENPDSLANNIKHYHDILSFLDHKNVVDRFSYVEGLLEEEGDKKVSLFLNLLTHVLRSKLLEGTIDHRFCAKTLVKISDAGMLIKKNVNKRLVLENLMLSL
jgi:DNA polymerase III subunit delta'